MLTFFKVSSLRKNYFNDYIFLLKNIFGIIITNSIIVAKPMLILQDDFSIEYDWEGEVMKVEFKKLTDDEVKLNYVGHKMGQKDKYVFGF